MTIYESWLREKLKKSKEVFYNAKNRLSGPEAKSFLEWPWMILQVINDLIHIWLLRTSSNVEDRILSDKSQNQTNDSSLDTKQLEIWELHDLDLQIEGEETKDLIAVCQRDDSSDKDDSNEVPEINEEEFWNTVKENISRDILPVYQNRLQFYQFRPFQSDLSTISEESSSDVSSSDSKSTKQEGRCNNSRKDLTLKQQVDDIKFPEILVYKEQEANEQIDQQITALDKSWDNFFAEQRIHEEQLQIIKEINEKINQKLQQTSESNEHPFLLCQTDDFNYNEADMETGSMDNQQLERSDEETGTQFENKMLSSQSFEDETNEQKLREIDNFKESLEKFCTSEPPELPVVLGIDATKDDDILNVNITEIQKSNSKPMDESSQCLSPNQSEDMTSSLILNSNEKALFQELSLYSNEQLLEIGKTEPSLEWDFYDIDQDFQTMASNYEESSDKDKHNSPEKTASALKPVSQNSSASSSRVGNFIGKSLQSISKRLIILQPKHFLQTLKMMRQARQAHVVKRKNILQRLKKNILKLKKRIQGNKKLSLKENKGVHFDSAENIEFFYIKETETEDGKNYQQSIEDQRNREDDKNSEIGDEKIQNESRNSSEIKDLKLEEQNDTISDEIEDSDQVIEPVIPKTNLSYDIQDFQVDQFDESFSAHLVEENGLMNLQEFLKIPIEQQQEEDDNFIAPIEQQQEEDDNFIAPIKQQQEEDDNFIAVEKIKAHSLPELDNNQRLTVNIDTRKMSLPVRIEEEDLSAHQEDNDHSSESLLEQGHEVIKLVEEQSKEYLKNQIEESDSSMVNSVHLSENVYHEESFLSEEVFQTSEEQVNVPLIEKTNSSTIYSSEDKVDLEECQEEKKLSESEDNSRDLSIDVEDQSNSIYEEDNEEIEQQYQYSENSEADGNQNKNKVNNITNLGMDDVE